jgi:AcrR family transcriptional regulator
VTEIVGEQKGIRRHARRNHELLLAAAREVFSEQGVAASLEEIARRAGLGIGTLYRHFATRDALVEAIFEERINEFIAIGRTANEEPDGWKALVGFLEQMLALQASDRLLKDVLMRYPSAPGRLATARAEMGQLFDQVLDRAQKQGQLRPDFTLPDLAQLFWSFTPIIDGTAVIAPNAWRRHLQWLLDGLRADNPTPQTEPPLTDEQLHAAMHALQQQRIGRRNRHE